MKVPFNDLYAQYQLIQTDIDRAMSEVIRDASFIKGPAVTQFENSFAQHIGVKHCIGCANGTDSLEILLKALGIGPGDEVIVPAATWISTSEAVTTVGATPIFVDVHPDFYTIDVSLIEKKITARTKAIIPVHFYGLAADMSGITAIAKSFNLAIIEDCAQAHLAEHNNRLVGSFGDAGSFSFFPGKNLGAYGDAGGITTDNDDLAEFCRKFANHGRTDKFDHQFEGRNSRLDTIQAAVLSVKLPHLKRWTSQRQSIAAMYSELLKGSRVKLPAKPNSSSHVYHLYVIQVENRSHVVNYLNDCGIQTGIHYPVLPPFSKAYARFAFKPEDFPVAYSMMNHIVSLPIFPEMLVDQIEYVATSVRSAVG